MPPSHRVMGEFAETAIANAFFEGRVLIGLNHATRRRIAEAAIAMIRGLPDDLWAVAVGAECVEVDDVILAFRRQPVDWDDELWNEMAQMNASGESASDS